MTSPDPATLEILRRRAEAAAEAMQDTMLRSAVSPIVREANDAGAALFLPDGTLVAQSNALPLLLGSLIPAVAAVLDAFPAAGMRPGDAYALNDPYAGGTHIPDLTLVAPAFAEGRLIGFAATILHHQDMGGLTPGTLPPQATDIFQEGLRLPPLRLVREGAADDQLLRVIAANTRTPEAFAWDLEAQRAACRLGVAALGELAARHGAEGMLGLLGELIEMGEAATRVALAELPDGCWRFADALDHDGVELDRPVPIAVAVSIQGKTLVVDFAGTSPQVRGPVNAVPAGMLAAAFWAMRAALLGPEVPANAGMLRALRLLLPEGSLVNPRPPAAVNARAATVKLAANAILGALAQALPDRLPAANTGATLVMAWSGRRADGSAWVVTELVAGGAGASARGPGVGGVSTDVSNAMNTPAEALESDAPVRLLRHALRRGSGGAGRHRGGEGILRDYEVLHGPLTLTFRGERHLHAPRGAAGGGDGQRAEAWVTRAADGRREPILSRATLVLETGDRLSVATAGAGGWG